MGVHNLFIHAFVVGNGTQCRLIHGTVRRQVEHIGLAGSEDIDSSGKDAEEKQQRKDRAVRGSPAQDRKAGKTAHKDQENVPQKSVESQGQIRMHQPRCLQKSHDFARQSKVLEEGTPCTADGTTWENG